MLVQAPTRAGIVYALRSVSRHIERVDQPPHRILRPDDPVNQNDQVAALERDVLLAAEFLEDDAAGFAGSPGAPDVVGVEQAIVLGVNILLDPPAAIDEHVGPELLPTEGEERQVGIAGAVFFFKADEQGFLAFLERAGGDHLRLLAVPHESVDVLLWITLDRMPEQAADG